MASDCVSPVASSACNARSASSSSRTEIARLVRRGGELCERGGDAQTRVSGFGADLDTGERRTIAAGTVVPLAINDVNGSRSAPKAGMSSSPVMV
jgi:hypothetical protein